MNLKPLIALALVATACKETSHGPEDGLEGPVMARRSPQTQRYAPDPVFMRRNDTFFFRVWDETFTRRLDDLPTAGEVPPEKRPYSGGYYAEQTGGTDVVMAGGKSPLQKYDEAFHGGVNRSRAWERANHTSGPVWAGHCNGFAATAQRHPKEPSRPVRRGDVVFDPRDIKALLAEVYMNADYEFLGGNRCEDRGNTAGPAARQDPTKMGDCEDINPGTLHAAVANWVGRMRHTLIMDQFRGDEVWNYPLFKYAITRLDKNITEAQARQYVTGGQGPYIFNPDATRFAYVQMTLTYAEATRTETLGRLNPLNMSLTYVLELNDAGEIIGGEWVGRSVQEHPDFLWVALEPMQPNGTRYMGNPHVDAGEVIKLWAESVGEDPESPPLDIKRPAAEDSWGRWPGFEVTVDGNQNGAVFTGKPATISIKRKEQYAGAGYEVEVGLNGASLTRLSADDDVIKYSFDPGLGMNRLQFVWKRDGDKVDEQYLRFHAVR